MITRRHGFTMRFTADIAFSLSLRQHQLETVISKHNVQAHIAIIVKRGKIIASATNSIGSRSRGCGYAEKTIHAERAAIKKLGNFRELDGACMVVIRIMKGTKELGYSEPCHGCKQHLEKCMKEYGLRRVYYSA
jgi:cytidine deaminase